MLNSPGVEAFNVQEQEIAIMLTGIVALGVFTQEQVNSLKVRGQKTMSRAEELGLPIINQQHVQYVRGN